MNVFNEVINPTLLDILYVICDHKSKTETLKNYLFRQITPPSNKAYNKFFNKGQLDQIDSNPLGNEFDVSLFAASFPLIAEYNTKLNASPITLQLMKNKYKQIKDIRNDLSHNLLTVSDATVHQYAFNDLKSCMNDLLDLIGTTFGCVSDTDARKIILRNCIDSIMATQHKDFDNDYVYLLRSLLIGSCSLLLVSSVINLRYFMKH